MVARLPDGIEVTAIVPDAQEAQGNGWFSIFGNSVAGKIKTNTFDLFRWRNIDNRCQPLSAYILDTVEGLAVRGFRVLRQAMTI